MGVQNVSAIQELLGKELVLVEDLFGVQIERRGRVIGVVNALPGSRCSEEFLLDQDDGDCCFYSPEEVTITAIA